MTQDRDIRFPDKKVDSGWKEQIERDRANLASVAGAPKNTPATSREFMNFLKSLVTQAMMSMGEIPHPMSGQNEVDPAAAKELIDLLGLLKVKTKGNCSPDESAVFDSVLPELQIKFSRLA